MIIFYKFMWANAIFAVFISACSTQAVQAEAPQADKQPTVDYHSVLGRSLSDKDIGNFIASNDCSVAGPFQSCKGAGLAFWIDAEQIVNRVYLYAGDATSGFNRYKGALPFGLSFYDPMWLVEEKLENLNEDDTVLVTWSNSVPQEVSSPDHMHYWAIYKQLGMTVIYDSPGADDDAYIYAILVNN